MDATIASLPVATPGNPRFPSTHWSMVCVAMDSQAPEQNASSALEDLCKAYWYPLYAYARRKGSGIEDAQDMVQSFFCELLTKRSFKRANQKRGRFRTFLLACFDNFQSNEWRKQAAEKRGFGRITSFDELMANAEDRYRHEPRDESDPSVIYARSFAKELVDRALSRLKAEFGEAGRSGRYEVLAEYLPGRKPNMTQAEAGRVLGLTENAVSQAVFKMKQRLGDILLDEIEQICATPEELESERKFIIRCWSA